MMTQALQKNIMSVGVWLFALMITGGLLLAGAPAVFVAIAAWSGGIITLDIWRSIRRDWNGVPG